MTSDQEGITFVITAYDYAGNKLDRMEFIAEDTGDIFENDEATTEFMVSTLNEYKERE